MTPVTDQTILEQLNQSSGMRPVTDPALLSQLNQQPQAEKQTLGFGDQMSAVVPDIWNETANRASAAGNKILDYFNPSSQANTDFMQRQKDNGPLSLAGIKDSAGRTMSLGGAALAVPDLALSTVTGTIRSVGGHTMAAAEHAAKTGLAPYVDKARAFMGKPNIDVVGQTAKQDPQEAYNRWANDVEMASTAAAPSRASPAGMRPGPPPALTPADVNIANVKNAATSVFNDPAVTSVKVPTNIVRQEAAALRNDLRTYSPRTAGVSFDIADEMARAKKPTVQQLKDWRQMAGTEASATQMSPGGNIGPTPGASAAMKVKSRLADLLEQHAPGWSEANTNYNAAKTAEDFSKTAIKQQIRAEGTASGDYYKKMQTAATNILANPRRASVFTPEELVKLQTIQSGTKSQQALTWVQDLLSNRMKHGAGALLGAGAGWGGGPITAAIGGVIGGAADAAISKGIVGIRNAGATKRAADLTNAVIMRSPYALKLAAQPGRLAPMTKSEALAALLSLNGHHKD